jgi:hypothetical protein
MLRGAVLKSLFVSWGVRATRLVGLRRSLVSILVVDCCGGAFRFAPPQLLPVSPGFVELARYQKLSKKNHHPPNPKGYPWGTRSFF